MKTKYYKCVALDHEGNRVSFIVSGKVMYTYKPNVWTPWRRYGAFIFTSLTDVRYFLEFNYPHTNYLYEVWECEAREVREIKRVVYVDKLNQLGRNRIIALLNKMNKADFTWNCFDINGAKPAPRGSFIASQIKLVRKLEPMEYND